MDDWRRKLERRNRARAGWHRPPTPSITSEKWAKIAAAVGIAILLLWLMTHDSVVDLRDQEPALPNASATPLPDGYEFYRRAAYDQAFDQLLPLADRGDGRAQCLVGKILVQGLGGVAADRIEGIKWLDLCIRNPGYEDDREARDLTDSIIQTAGWEIVGEGKFRAFQWQQTDINTQNGEPGMASERMLRDLQTLGGDDAFALGSHLNNGLDMPVDYEKALRCFRRAAEFNVTGAIFNIGLAYYVGKGVKADPVEAQRWLKTASDNGFAQAATLLGLMIARGHGAEQDIEAALAYLKRGADLGDPDASLIRKAIADGEVPR